MASNWLDPHEWVSMTFDPDLQVNVRPIIEHLTGRCPIALNEVLRADMKEQVADMLEQFIELRRRVAAYEGEAE